MAISGRDPIPHSAPLSAAMLRTYCIVLLAVVGVAAQECALAEDGRDVESQNSKMEAAGRHRSVTRDGIFVNQLSPHEREALIRPTMVYVSWRCVWCFALR